MHLLKLLLLGVSFLKLIEVLLDVIVRALGRPVMVFSTSHYFLALHAFFMYSSFSFQGDGPNCAHCFQALAKAVVKTSHEPKLLLVVNLGVILSITRHLHDVPFILYHHHVTLSHGTELLHLLDH
jgi:hypothetical protein